MGAAALMMLSLPVAASTSDAPPRADGPQTVNYPMDLQRAGKEGTVSIQVYVLESGRVQRARLVQSSGDDDLDNAAVASVMSWKFNPAVRGGDTVSDWATVRVVYKVPAGGQ
jgi:TonB family protein